MLKFIKERWNTICGKSSEIGSVYINTLGTMCTNHCYMCPLRTQEIKNTRIPEATFEKIIKQLKDINFTGELHLYGQNEPFLDSTIFEKIAYVKKEIPQAKITIISNFTVLNSHEKIINLIKAPITYLSCSIYALKADVYKDICGRDNYKRSIINQIKFVKEYAKKRSYSFAIYLMNSPFNQDDIEFCKYFIFDILPVSRTKFYEVFGLFNTKHLPKKHHPGYISNCIYNNLMFMNDGDVSLCSVDASGVLKVGSIHDMHIKDLMNSKKAIELRTRMLKDKSDDAHCRYCWFGCGENKFFYFLPVPDRFRKYLNNKYNIRYSDDHDVRNYSSEEIKTKLIRFNEIFKDDAEEMWLDAIESLRKEFYANQGK